MIYFDQAASSFPKPPQVSEAMAKAVNSIGANPGRGGHALSREAAEIINKTREKAAKLFGCSNPKRVLFYQNATVALNQAIKGLDWEEGDHVITTSMEHNSVRRPLEYIKRTYGVNISYITWENNVTNFIKCVKNEITSKTKLLAITHASNVTGAILPIEELIKVANQHEILILVDASQTAGHIPINMKDQGIDMLVFPGHKGLLGPQGTGLLMVEKDLELNPLHHGGTGTYSEVAGQPEQWPEKLESGTLNTPGIAGLYAALIEFEQRSFNNVPRETLLINTLINGLNQILGVKCYGPGEDQKRLPIIAFNIRNVSSQEVAMILDSHYNIAVRGGLHCSPLTHETIHTAEQGVIRASLSIYNTNEQVTQFLQAIEEIALAYKDIT